MQQFLHILSQWLLISKITSPISSVSSNLLTFLQRSICEWIWRVFDRRTDSDAFLQNCIRWYTQWIIFWFCINRSTFHTDMREKMCYFLFPTTLTSNLLMSMVVFYQIWRFIPLWFRVNWRHGTYGQDRETDRMQHLMWPRPPRDGCIIY